MDKIISLISEHVFETCISAIVAYFVYRQWKTAEEEKKLKLFDKRFEFYTKYMLNPLWKQLFYNRETISVDSTIKDVINPYLEDQAYFIFPKRIYDKISLTIGKMGVIVGYQKGLNIIREYPCKGNKDKEYIESLIKYLDDTFNDDSIKQLKKDYEKACDILYNYIVIENECNIWQLIANAFIKIWDFFVPYNVNAIKEKRKTEEEVYKWLRVAKKENNNVQSK